MSTFVLVHGSFHGAWCWSKVVPLLERSGHVAVCLDLPGHGDDATPLAEITLDGYARRICEVCCKQPGPVVLVGHSMGGGAITQAAEQCAPQIGVLVYVAAFVPRNGLSLAEIALSDEGSLLSGTVQVDPDRGVASLEDASIDACFYTDCAPDDVAFARARLRDDPLAPLMTPVAIRGTAGAALPRVYVECLRDAAISVAHQRAMRSGLHWDHVSSLDTGHSPFLSVPEALADRLLAAADFAR